MIPYDSRKMLLDFDENFGFPCFPENYFWTLMRILAFHDFGKNILDFVRKLNLLVVLVRFCGWFKGLSLGRKS